jgi:hypothetical protein
MVEIRCGIPHIKSLARRGFAFRRAVRGVAAAGCQETDKMRQKDKKV